MFDRDKWQEIFGTIKKHKLRTGLTAFGVFWGIFMLIFILGMGSGLENGVFKDFGARAKNIMYVNAWRTTKPYKGYPAGRRIRMELNDLYALKENVVELDRVAPRTSLNNSLIAYKDQNENYELRGELTDMINIEALEVVEGRYINDLDLKENRKVAVIGRTVKDVLFGEDEDAIGKYIKVRGLEFKVVGIYGPMQLKEWTRSDMESVVIPLTTMFRAFGTGEFVDWFVCSAKAGIPVSQMESKIQALLKERHSVHPEDPRGIFGFNLEEEFQQVSNLFIGIKFFLWFVGIGTLLAGIIGVSNIMLIVVKERTKEIGIRKALGATPNSIISMILTESIFLTSISGYMGLLIGTLIIGGLDYLMIANDVEAQNFHHPEVNLMVGIGSVITLIVAGAIAGLIPALNAARINPVIALKDE